MVFIDWVVLGLSAQPAAVAVTQDVIKQYVTNMPQEHNVAADLLWTKGTRAQTK
jgi:hypothetical protein